MNESPPSMVPSSPRSASAPPTSSRTSSLNALRISKDVFICSTGGEMNAGAFEPLVIPQTFLDPDVRLIVLP